MADDDREKPIRQAAGVLGGILVGFALGDAGLASNSVGPVALAVGMGGLAFAFGR